MGSSAIASYRDLIVWRRAIELVEAVYTLSGHFPEDERFGLTSQLRRAAVSVASNIAEGKSRGTRKEYRQFLVIAYGSSAEVETQLYMAKKLHFVDDTLFKHADILLDEVMKMLRTLIFRLKTSQPPNLKTS